MRPGAYWLRTEQHTNQVTRLSRCVTFDVAAASIGRSTVDAVMMFALPSPLKRMVPVAFRSSRVSITVHTEIFTTLESFTSIPYGTPSIACQPVMLIREQPSNSIGDAPKKKDWP